MVARYTYAVLEISGAAFAEIKARIETLGPDYDFMLNVSDDIVFGNYGLRRRNPHLRDDCAASCDRQIDNPELDGTDFAHPAWWRGNDAGVRVCAQLILEMIRAPKERSGTAREPWESARQAIFALLDQVAAKTGDSTEVAGILATEFSERFVQLMANRMVVSFHKYGALADAYPEKVHAIGSLSERLRKYIDTGNTEWLVDVANFAMIEFMRPAHPNAHFAGTDDDASPGRLARRGGQFDKRGNAEIGKSYVSPLAQFRKDGE